MDAADPRRRDAAEEGVMAFPSVIARRAKRAEAIPHGVLRGGDCFAEPVLGLAEGKTRGLAMTGMGLFLILLASPAIAADGDIDQGRDTYHELCAPCHGRDMVNAGTLSFDLRKFPRDDADRFKNSVLNGKGRAMPAWADKLTDEDIANLWAYVKSGG
jgi:mono/diheme cytochrome c family protein